MKRSILSLALFATAASPALADEIILTNGRKIVGVHRKDRSLPGKIVVDVGAGTIVLDARQVSAVNPGRTALHEFERRWEGLRRSHDVDALHALAVWCRDRKVTRHLREVCDRILAVDPGHEGAHTLLGHQRVKGVWMEYEEAQRAKGFVKVGGRWMTVAERALIEQRRLQEQERRMQAKLERERKKEEARQRRLDAIQDYQDWLARESQLPYGYMYRPNWFWPAYYRPYPWTPYKHKRPPGGYGWDEAVPTFPITPLFFLR